MAMSMDAGNRTVERNELTKLLQTLAINNIL